MSDESSTRRPVTRKRQLLGVLGEAFLICGIGFGLGLLANRLSPRGLSLGRDYFPPAPVVQGTDGANGTNAVNAANATNATNAAAAVVVSAEVRARLAARGLRLMELPEARRLFEDPRRLAERVVFIDARNEKHFDEGHVPGAYLFDRYYPENHLPTVLPACLGAEQVVVYCQGGECEDSELAGAALLEAGIPGDRVGVYVGGMTEWAAAGLPIEVGSRGSGQLKEGNR